MLAINSDPIQNVAVSTLTSSAIVVFVLQKLKQSKWFPFAQDGSAKLNRACSFIGAALSAAAVSWAWNGSARTLTIQIPTLLGCVTALWHWLNHYAMQEILYQVTLNKQSPSPISSSKS